MTQVSKIVIFGEANLRASLLEQFALHPDVAPFEAGDGAAALALIARETPDALLVDAAAPSAAELVAKAREAGFSGAVVLLAAGAPHALDGVDAYVSRPFRFADLLARVQERSRKDVSVVIGPYLFCLDAQELRNAAGERQRLTEKEAAILARLARAKGAVTPKDVLLRDVWGYREGVTTRTLETHIHRLRRKLEAEPGRPRLLLTAPGGYQLATSGDETPPNAQQPARS